MAAGQFCNGCGYQRQHDVRGLVVHQQRIRIQFRLFYGQGADSAPLHALQSGVDGGNGVYAYASGPQFPISTYGDNNYWVDVTFSSSGGTTPPPLTLTCPANTGRWARHIRLS